MGNRPWFGGAVAKASSFLVPCLREECFRQEMGVGSSIQKITDDLMAIKRGVETSITQPK